MALGFTSPWCAHRLHSPRALDVRISVGGLACECYCAFLCADVCWLSGGPLLSSLAVRQGHAFLCVGCPVAPCCPRWL